MKSKKTFIFFFVAIIIFSGVAIFFAVRYPLLYREEIINYSKTYNLDTALVASLINEESSFDKNALSSKGAMGLMQIMPQTATYVQQLIGEDRECDLYEPKDNIRIGCYYLNYLYQKFNDQILTLCAYNAGENTVRMWLANENYSQDGKTLNYIPYPQTKAYVDKILYGIRFYKYRLGG